MGTTLTGTTPQDTYDSLIKVTDNGPISGTAKYLSDGLGNDSVLALSTAGLGVGTTTPNIYATGGASNVVGIQAVGTDAGAILAVAGTGTGFSGIDIGNQTIRRAFLGALNGSDFGIYTNPTNTGANVTERMRITSAGDVAIGSTSTSGYKLFVNGSIYFAGATNFIDGTTVFRPTGTEVGRFTANGLTFNGDTAAANALDDYEEGTWTMGVAFGGASVGVTTSANTGTYTKIGRQVTVNGYIELTSKGSSTGSARITGLPFSIPNLTQNYATAGLYLGQTTFTNQFMGYGVVNTTTIQLDEVTILGAITPLENGDFANNSVIMVNFTYFV
jgi:hypothetical protein